MILCITHSQDTYTIDLVQQHLEQLGYPSFRFNSDEFGTRYRLRYRLTAAGPQYQLEHGNTLIDAADITGVWYRKLWELKVPASLDPAYVPAFVKEYNTSLHIFLDSLDVPWINRIDIDHAVSGNKLLQLTAAQAAGLAVPQTLFSNHAEDAIRFYDDHNGDVVVKLHGALSKTMDGRGDFFPTTRLRKEDVPMLESLSACPMILQQYIPKDRELRIVYVDGEFFTGSLRAPDTTDWRTASTTIIQWEPFVLPPAQEEKITRLMQLLGLPFGAIDMIVQPDGQYVFLEVNPQGEWGMLQKYLGFPIAETIAEKLVQKITHA
ncbi:ATP-grasp ribosomal peptide maturase [Chitinophaga lutea]|uniref:ATP-grasp ribosomal peptide maturase n=1 Tax=Chitinophaga lutea TaxID=2488634 RepID=A0A3N4PPB1_9BACT|nr:ATP-grasp ribosomal peptide maturase [Chitinophaga lutea]RPE05580.1 ATP-grasp ribosomal peptide maturase [Chitinophaga lutea]